MPTAFTGNEDIKVAYTQIIERLCDADAQTGAYGYDRTNLTVAEFATMGMCAAFWAGEAAA